MDINDCGRHPAKRPRLGEAPNGSQLEQTYMQSSHTYYPTWPLNQQGITGPASNVVPKTEHSDRFDPGYSESSGQWMVSGSQSSFGVENMASSTGHYPNQPFSTLHHQNYAGQMQMTCTEQFDVRMGLPPLPFSPLGHFPFSPYGPPCPTLVPASLPSHELIQHSQYATERLTLKAEVCMTDESYYRTLEDSQVDVSEESENIEAEVVCFGMIANIDASFERQRSSNIPSTFSVQIESSNRFGAQDGIQIDGQIPVEYGEMIQGLMEEPTLTLHVSCMVDDKPAGKKISGKFELSHCILEITVYGSLDIFEEIGTWFQGHEIYLQDPRSCHMEVKYCNPQRLSAHDLDTCPLLSQVVSDSFALNLQDITRRPDPLDILSSQIDLEETPQPSVIRTALKRHQKQALTFMLHREQGWGFNNGQPDIWEKENTRKGRMFINTISDVYQPEEPPQFYGGIIADPMGLGKTLTMIALVATDLDTNIGVITPKDSTDYDKFYSSATLIIVPPPLLSTWEEQLSDHVAEGSLKCCRHHAQTKIANAYELGNVNIVLTTYHTVSAEWKSNSLAGSSILFQVRWRRIILDEAHFIRNGNSRMARAICDLDSVARWAVTGTPIQNRLGDLVSLLKFIRVHPYDNPERFDADISQLWKSGEDQNAIKRLQRLSACLLLRRAKGTISLPPRRDFLLPVQLTHEERAVYNEIREQTIIKIDEALHKDPGTSRARGYVSILQQIESLRLFCNLGLQYRSKHEKDLQSSDWSRVAQSAFITQSGMHSLTCLRCSSTLNISGSLLDDSTTGQNLSFFSCLGTLCAECVSEDRRTRRESTCGHSPSCPVASVSASSIVLEEISDLIVHEAGQESTVTSLPSKIKALITDLQTVPPNVKCIVFSTWRLTLDVIEKGLDQASIRSIRFDGKVPQRDRQGVIDKFRSDPSICVMLLTLSCGAVGLTLTAASRAYLMEPHWNPTLEEQALARIYRLGQTRDVTTVRLYVKDSFEEQVMQLQESKKNLASVLLSPHDGGKTDNSSGALEVVTPS